MTPLGWIFMLVSVTFVTTLLAWCYRKVLTGSETPDRHDPGSDRP